MSSSSSNSELISLLNEISLQFNRYFSLLILLFGTIGNLLNILVLIQPSLRSNPCAFLFLGSSLANLISIVFGLTTRLLAGWNLDFTRTNNLLCKCRVHVMFTSRTIAFWLIALASLDRWFSSCTTQQRRRLSSMKTARRGTILISLFAVLCYVQVFYCYESNLIDAPLRCYGKTVMCRLLMDSTYAFLTVLCPIFIMSFFGLLTISNVRNTYTAVLVKKKGKTPTLSVTYAQCQRWKKLDRHLRRVLFRQIILLTILILPQVIEKLYTTLTITANKSSLHQTVDIFIYNIVLLLTYAASGMPFYIYTLSGRNIFRTTFYNLLQATYERIQSK